MEFLNSLPWFFWVWMILIISSPFSHCRLLKRVLKNGEGVKLLMNKLNPGVFRVVINIDKNIFFPSKTLNLHGSHNIHMNQFMNMNNGKMLHPFKINLSSLPHLTVSINFPFFNLEIGYSNNILFNNNLPHTF